jgi:hypothetical protein
LSGDYTWTKSSDKLIWSGSTNTGEIALDSAYTWSEINAGKITATQKTASDLSTCSQLEKTTCAVTTE